MHVSVDEEGFLGCELEREVRDAYSCRAGIEIGGILAHGEISACPSVSRRLVQGNIRKESFADCWENKFQPFRDRQWMRQGAAGTARNGGYARETASTCGISTRTHRTSVTSTAFTARSVYENYRSIGKKAVQLQEDRLAVPMWYAAAVG